MTLTETLLRELRISERELATLVRTAPERYKVYTIPKRTGGTREIAHPASELKTAQRVVVKSYLETLPVHPCATAYRPGASIRQNAERHSHNRAILKYDFTEFFPSITERAWLSYCDENETFGRQDAIMSGRLLFRRPKGGRILRLSIGAPSSPILSNVLMNAFDRAIYDRVTPHKITYTRYADDLTFSAERTWNLKVVDGIIRSVINRLSYPKLTINNKKTILVTPKYHRQITGLVLTLDGRVSLGRDRKRNIRSAIFHYSQGKLDRKAEVKLAGTLAFAKDVEPEFYTRMERVYGKELIDNIKFSVNGYQRDQ
ncbi:retron St85 family RNA-directed DNA polymerase [Sphingomonas sp. S1-29]|uniref:retron St85 family RNA-directed DNA polymerase n=1 Tax=Sphingomonas sp. S1-29 TaxID=2991074 RepID=UPI00223F504F|nr:retron St85 family RNA-directed DNA polymerase [Sphingomonas sp. S1-29]UZK69966.1 retron St85 family RNA-directed DNA polymerase [Sphingomonas sp. S1-29]